MSKHVFSVNNGQTCVDGKEFLVKGLRCSNGLLSDEVTGDLIAQLGTYSSYGLNTVSVYFMGNRFGDIGGYNEDGSLNPVYTGRMGRIIEAADSLGMLVLVGCLYWGESRAKWNSWTQKEANAAVRNTAAWLKEKLCRNVFIDIDNEGMARREKGFDSRELVLAAKAADPYCMVAANYAGQPPEEADLCIHFSNKVKGKPYIESEGVPENAPGGYWMRYSREEDPFNTYRNSSRSNYINIGIYTDEMKADQIARTRRHLENGWGYMLASTWLQAVPPYGPNHAPGGYGTADDPGIRWWMKFIKDNYK